MSTEPEKYRTRDNFYLPNFCAPVAVLGVLLVSELVAIGLTMARQPGWGGFFSDLAKTSLLLVWMGLSVAAVLCVLRERLARFPVFTASTLTIAAILAVMLLVSEAVYWLGYVYGWRLEGVTQTWFPDNHWFFLSRNLALGALIGGLALRYFYVSHQWQRNVEQQAESRILALQARIRPHFLFNSMNTIAALTRTQPAAAEAAVEDLADLFRASLSDSHELISLEQEIDITRGYERMEKKRLGDRLVVDWCLDDLPMSARIPSLTLQPLLENAIYHGIEPLPEKGVVEIEGRRKGDMIYMSVRNPLPIDRFKSGPGNQLAMSNIRERLELAFGPRARMSRAIDQTHYQVSIAFPYKRPA